MYIWNPGGRVRRYLKAIGQMHTNFSTLSHNPSISAFEILSIFTACVSKKYLLNSASLLLDCYHRSVLFEP